MGGIKQLFPGRDKLALGPKGVGGLVFLGAIERFVDAQPGKTDAGCSHGVPQAVAGIGGVG